MTTLQKLTDQFLTCTVCHEIFTELSPLSCDHSFCARCIEGFTETRAAAIRSKSILCPFCRRMTGVPDPFQPVEEWSGQMRANLLLKGLGDTIGPGTRDASNCNWCHDEGKTTPAISWCPICDVSLFSNCLKAYGLKSLKSRSREFEENKSSVQFSDLSPAQRVTVSKTKENELLDKLTEVTDKQMDQLKADIKTGDVDGYTYRQQFELTDQAWMEMDMYDLYLSSESEAEESVADVKKRGTSLGKIQVLDVFDLDTLSSPVLNRTVDCRTKEDQDMPQFLDILSMEVKGSDTIIVTDQNNKCIKSFFKRNKQQHHSRLSMDSIPYQIIKLDDNKIAVTIPDCRQIAVVAVTPDLTLDSTITTQKQYTGLTALTPTTLAASSVSSPLVDIIDIRGNLMRSIRFHHIPIIRKPCCLCTTRKGNILITDCEFKSLMCATPQGEVVFKYSPTGDRALEGPAGITSTATGHILVADCDRDKVIVLNECGEFVRDLLTSQDGICGPWGIDWDERGRIYVTQFSEVGDHTLRVFTFEERFNF